MLRFKDNQVTGSKFQEWSFSIVHNNSEQSFDSLKHFSHKTKLLLPKFCPPAVLLRQKNPNFSFLAFVKNLLDAKSSNAQNWKLCWAHQKIRRNTTMGGIWDLGVAANSGKKKITHINFATLIGRVFVCCNDAEKDVIPTWLSAANIDDNSSIFVRCDHLTKAASAVKQDA